MNTITAITKTDIYRLRRTGFWSAYINRIKSYTQCEDTVYEITTKLIKGYVQMKAINFGCVLIYITLRVVIKNKLRTKLFITIAKLTKQPKNDKKKH